MIFVLFLRTGELISDKAKEVHNITLAFNIQVDNPVCVLNQDTSRNFLSSSNSNNKFILFQRATRLDILAEEYENLYSNNRKAYNILKDQDQVSFLIICMIEQTFLLKIGVRIRFVGFLQ